MAEQAKPATSGGGMAGAGSQGGTMGASASGDPAPFVSQVAGTPVSYPTFHGRPVSWSAVTLILIGFLAGGLALVFGPTWWLFWVSIGIAAVGALLALGTGIFEDWY